MYYFIWPYIVHCDMYVKCVCWIQYLCMPNKFRFEYYRRTEHK